MVVGMMAVVWWWGRCKGRQDVVQLDEGIWGLLHGFFLSLWDTYYTVWLYKYTSAKNMNIRSSYSLLDLAKMYAICSIQGEVCHKYNAKHFIYIKELFSTRGAEMQAAVEVASLSACASTHRCPVAPRLQREIAKAADNFSNISQLL